MLFRRMSNKLCLQVNDLSLYFYFQQPSWRYWGEERIPDAVYTVYLKKVRYHSPSKSVHSVSSTSKDR